MKGYHVSKHDNQGEEKNKTSSNDSTRRVKENTNKDSKIKRVYFYNGIGYGITNSLIANLDVNYRGFGAYLDVAYFGKNAYGSTGIYYDLFSFSNHHSLKVGVSFWGNPRFAYEYLWSKKGKTYYIGLNGLYVSESYLLKEEWDIKILNPDYNAKDFLNTSIGFVPINLVFGIRMNKLFFWD